MLKTWTHRKACRLCNSRHVVPVLKFAFTPPGTCYIQSDGSALITEKLPLIVSLCEKCRHIQMLDVVDPVIQFDTYPHTGITTSAVNSHYEAYASDAVARGRLNKGDFVIDIGCGDGTLMRAFRKLGMNVIGVDPSTQAVAQAKIDGIPIFKDQFSPNIANKIIQKYGNASLITANYTLGSVDNLHAVAAGARHLLKKDGLFFFEEPSLPDIIKNNMFDLVHHERISFFTAIPLEAFFKSTLLHLIDLKRNDFRGGTIRGVVQRSDGHHVVASSLPETIQEEKRSALQSVETLTAFANSVEIVKADLKKIVQDLKSQGKKIAGYGASSRTVTFIHECGWDSDTIAFIADDSHNKHDFRVPGTSISVVHPDAIRDRKPDAIIIFAVNDAGEIMKNNDAFRQTGGKFIIPFPRPTVQ
ncbi:MAG TPA: class I SAM-dependent methyltransferase [Kiritimatiellia bacterium]|nr:class I SAM-dependent methyltransferase [Kiritimatiellia bacterium]